MKQIYCLVQKGPSYVFINWGVFVDMVRISSSDSSLQQNWKDLCKIFFLLTFLCFVIASKVLVFGYYL